MRSKAIIYITAILAIILGCISCSSWNTDSLGMKFTPANSLVRNYRRQVYVEYGVGKARVWGEAAGFVETAIEGGHVTLSFDKDSIALFVYGYTTADTTQVGGDASLTIRAKAKTGYALYLNGTSIYNPHGPAIQSLGNSPCLVVLSARSRNTLTSASMDGASGNANGCFYTEGELQFSGTGTLNVNNLSTAANLGNGVSAGLFGCSHNVTVNIKSLTGNAILAQNEINISNGKWDLTSSLSNIKAELVLLTSGTFNAHCHKGSFVETHDRFSTPALLRNPTVTSLAARYTNYADSAFMAQYYLADSLYYPKQYKPDFELLKDSTYTIYYHRDTLDKKLSTFKPRATLPEGYILISNSTLNNADQIFVTKDK